MTVTPARRPFRRAARAAGEAVLWCGALLGLACILGGVAAVVLGVRPMVVQSGSMSPAIPTGALVLAVSVPAAEVSEGDVVSVPDARGRRITHRVVEARPAGPGASGPVALTLQGDANQAPDAEPYVVSAADRVVADVPLLGYVVGWFAGGAGTFVLGAVAAALALSVVRGRAGRRPQSLTLGAVVLLVAATWSWPSTRPAGTAAAFSDSPAVASGFATPPVLPGPAGTVGCTNGASFSGSLTLSWSAVSGQTSRYRYRVEIYAASGLSSNLLKSYVLAGTSQVVPHSDLDRDLLWSGTGSVRVFATVDGTVWRSVGDIRRTIYVGLSGSDYRCQF